MQSPVYPLLKHYLTAPTALGSVFGATVAWQGLKKGMPDHVLMHSFLSEAKHRTRRCTCTSVAVGVTLNLLNSPVLSLWAPVVADLYCLFNGVF